MHTIDTNTVCNRHITTLGALAVTLALAFDPFVQNSIQFSPKLLSDPNQIAQVANNSVYDAVQNGTRTGDSLSF